MSAIDAVVAALDDAIAELRLHNCEYNWITPPEKIDRFVAARALYLAEQAEKAAA